MAKTNNVPDPQKLDEFTWAYIEALFFTDEEQLEEERGEKDKGDPLTISDFHPETLEVIIEDCRTFQARHSYMFGNASLAQAGHDFWLTRNGHGAGFWDRPEIYGKENSKILTSMCGWRSTFFKELATYIGDDGKIYF